LFCPVDESSPADQDAAETDEAVVDVQAPFPTHGEAADWCSSAKIYSTT